MSTLATNAITDASGGNTATINGYTPTMSNMAGRNKIINGDMRIDQRNAGAAVNLDSTPYAVDRFNATITSALFSGTGTLGQSSVAPIGFVKSLLWTQTTGVTPSSTQIGSIQYGGIEGQDITDLNFGSSDAKTITISFWVQSSVTGKYCCFLRNLGNDLTYAASYSINTANTWEYKTIQVAGPTTGTWNSGNLAGIRIGWDLGSGSNFITPTENAWVSGNYRTFSDHADFVNTSGATFYITGVQLEAGSVATPFEHRPYGQELALCQRYYEKYTSTGNYFVAVSVSNYPRINGTWLVAKRANPTTTPPSGWSIGGTVTHYEGYNSSATDALFPSFSADAEL